MTSRAWRTCSFEESTHRWCRVNGEDAVTLEVLKQSGENTVATWLTAVKDLMVEPREESSPRVCQKQALIIDQSQFIEHDVKQVEHDIVFGGAMAILIILIFMLDLRSTLIVKLGRFAPPASSVRSSRCTCSITRSEQR